MVDEGGVVSESVERWGWGWLVVYNQWRVVRAATLALALALLSLALIRVITLWFDLAALQRLYRGMSSPP